MKFFFFLFFLLFSFSARAEITNIPNMMSAPVVLYDEANNVLSDGDYLVTITLSDFEGQVLYSEEQQTKVFNGAAHLSIGQGYVAGSNLTVSTGGLSTEVFRHDGEISFTVQVQGQLNPQEITVLGSQPYAFVSDHALTVANDAVTSLQIRDGSITRDDISALFLQELFPELNAGGVLIDDDLQFSNIQGTTVGSALLALDTAVGNLQTSLTSAEEEIATHTTELETRTQEISENASSISNLESDLTTLEGTVSTVEGSVATVSTSVSSVSTNVSLLQGSVGALSSNVSVLQSDVDSVSSNISSVSSGLSVLQSDTTSLSSTVTTHTSQIDALDTRVTVLETEPEPELAINVDDIPSPVRPRAYGRLETNACANNYGSTCSVSGAGYAGTVQFTTPLPDANYVVLLTSHASSFNAFGLPNPTGTICRAASKTATGFSVFCLASTNATAGTPVTGTEFIVFHN